MFPSRLVRSFVESNDSREVCWVRVTSKHERLPQDQWGFVFQGSKGFADKVCFEIGRIEIIAYVAL